MPAAAALENMYSLCRRIGLLSKLQLYEKTDFLGRGIASCQQFRFIYTFKARCGAKIANVTNQVFPNDAADRMRLLVGESQGFSLRWEFPSIGGGGHT